MDSREPPQPPQPPQLQSMAQAQHPSAAPNMMMGPTSYGSAMPNPNTSPMISPNSTAAMMAPATAARFPFNTMVPQPPAPSKPMEHLNNNASPFDGSSSAMRPCGFNIDSTKKKRGRPRKYSPDGNIALGLTPTPMSTSAGQGDSSGTPSTEPGTKKHRGRPPGSGKRQLDALGTGGIGFTPHVILVKAGEDIAGKIVAFSKQGPRTVCILSAIGAISNVTLRQAAISGGTVQYEGRFEIISLSGSFLPCDDNGRSRAGGFSVSLAGSDGKVLGGGVAGMLIAASPVQVIVGSFIADGKKSNSNIQKSGPSSAPASQMLNFGAPTTSTSPASQGPSSESSDENDNNSDFNRGPGLYNNNSQPIHNMQMYHPQLWAGQTQQ
ncbi:AT-hook motif nuclear-localized protein 13-like [Neltuma alba]|uniref:AT-hook motif nuclear-localized protein 13-like n=1 Tax=Neltuma alba TaxID=207710 RepID=UPI0010A3AE39|nr:AT-hook motif nuclear-localized protein 13-like [Prosopis alba]